MILSNVIAIDTDNEIIHFYSTDSKDKEDKKTVKHDAQSYHARPFDEEFYEKFSHILKLHRDNNPHEQLQKVSLVLPNSAFFTDTVNIPTMHKKAMASFLDVAVRAIYKNADEIRYNAFAVAQNKQYTTYALVGIRKDIVNRLKAVCSDNHISVSNITSFANATVNGAYALEPKLKNSSFVLLDIKERASFYSIVVKGKTLGFYSLPFGYSILSDSEIFTEDLLFDHSPAHLVVLNAKAKARAKHLALGEDVNTMDDDDVSVETRQSEAEDIIDFEDNLEFVYSACNSKKTARKLPKSLLREEPTNKEGYVYENFRHFLKWTIELISNNKALVNLGNIDAVYVNMPQGNEFLYDMINTEQEEHKISFLPLSDHRYNSSLELMGGLSVKQYNKINNF